MVLRSRIPRSSRRAQHPASQTRRTLPAGCAGECDVIAVATARPPGRRVAPIEAALLSPLSSPPLPRAPDSDCCRSCTCWSQPPLIVVSASVPHRNGERPRNLMRVPAPVPTQPLLRPTEVKCVQLQAFKGPQRESVTLALRPRLTLFIRSKRRRFSMTLFQDRRPHRAPPSSSTALFRSSRWRVDGPPSDLAIPQYVSRARLLVTAEQIQSIFCTL